jgi:hypothetical protein
MELMLDEDNDTKVSEVFLMRYVRFDNSQMLYSSLYVLNDFKDERDYGERVTKIHGPVDLPNILKTEIQEALGRTLISGLFKDPKVYLLAELILSSIHKRFLQGQYSRPRSQARRRF